MRLCLLLLLAALLSVESTETQSRRIRWFTNAGLADENWRFTIAHLDVVTGLYPCCGVLSAASNGSLLLATSVGAAHNMSSPYRQLGLTIHPVIGLNDPATLEAAAAVGSTFAADALSLCERFNFSGVTFDFEAQASYQTYARLLKAVSTALHNATPRREVVVCVSTSNIFSDPAAFAAIQAAGVDLQLSMSTYKWDSPGHEQQYVEVLTKQGVPTDQISAGVLSCPRNYSAGSPSHGCAVQGSTGSQGDWT